MRSTLRREMRELKEGRKGGRSVAVRCARARRNVYFAYFFGSALNSSAHDAQQK